jgi:Fic family protein
LFDLAVKITVRAAARLGEIERLLGGWAALKEAAPPRKVQWSNRVGTALATVALAGNNLSLELATKALQGRRGLLSAREVLELENAQLAYEHVSDWDPLRENDLLQAHRLLMDVLLVDAGRTRKGQLATLRSLFRALGEQRDVPPILSAIIFHYELRRIRPFSDGNGRLGRLWQHALLRRASPLFEHAPVEALLHEHQAPHFAALNAASKLGSVEPFLEHMLDMLLRALERLGGQLRGKPETPDDRLAKASQALAKRWFTRKGYLALFPQLSTASASRDLARARARRALTTRGERRSTEYRFR